MQHFEASIIINRPIEEVFARAADLTNHAIWTPGMIESRVTSDGAMKVGSTYVYNTIFLGKRMDSEGEIIAYEPPFLYRWKASTSPFSMSGGMIFEAVDGGTKVTQFSDSEPGGFYKLTTPFLKNAAKQYPETLQKMKEWMESRG